MISERSKIFILFIGIAIAIALVCSSIILLIPKNRVLTIDGRITKVTPFGDNFNVTFDTSHGIIQKTISKNSFQLINGYNERLYIKLYGYTDTPIYHWDGVYTIYDVTKLDNYAK